MKKARFIFNRAILQLGLNVKEFIPLVGSLNPRGLDVNVSAAPTKDQLFQNCLFYPVKNPFTGKDSLYVSRRPGVPASGTSDSANFSLGSITGFYYWKALGTTVRYGFYNPGFPTYRMIPVDSTGAHSAQDTGLSPIVHVSETKNSSGTPCIVYISAAAPNTYTTMYVWADGDAADTAVTVPSGSCGHPVHMDGYTFVANTDGKIYNSPLNDITGSYTDFIGTDMDPDKLVTLGKRDEYVWAFGTHSMECFRITENVTGSPLQRVTENFHKIGIFKRIASGGLFSSLSFNAPPIVNGNDTLYWLGQEEGHLGVYQMDGNSPKKISGAFEDKYLQNFNGYFKYLVIGKRRLLLIGTPYLWLVLDIESGIWSTWLSTKSGTFSTWFNTGNGEGLVMASGTTYYTWVPGDTVPYLDVDATITRTIRTSNIDFDNNELKDFPGLTILGDRASSTSNIAVRWSKDDYQTWTSSKNIDMSSTYPGLYALGVGRRIAFEFSDTVQSEQRLRGFELDYNIRD